MKEELFHTIFKLQLYFLDFLLMMPIFCKLITLYLEQFVLLISMLKTNLIDPFSYQELTLALNFLKSILMQYHA